MQTKNAAYLLTGLVLLGPVVYTSEASAAMVLTPDSATVFSKTVSTGSFENIYDFAIDNDFSAYNLSGSFSFQSAQVLGSFSENFSTPIPLMTSGISNATFRLLDSTSTVIATGSLSSFSEMSDPASPTALSPLYIALSTTYNTVTFNNIPVLGAGNYQLAVNGSSINSGSYTGSLSVSPIAPTAAVPLPGTIWLFLTGALGFVGSKRKKALKA